MCYNRGLEMRRSVHSRNKRPVKIIQEDTISYKSHFGTIYNQLSVSNEVTWSETHKSFFDGLFDCSFNEPNGATLVKWVPTDSPALQNTPAAVRVTLGHTWLTVFLLLANLHWHFRDLQKNNNNKNTSKTHHLFSLIQNIWCLRDRKVLKEWRLKVRSLI